ncbi:hypothetical protein [Burkholderia gladioli]|uniref:hypothetical protein n=1 Tax=Burkholderia gladioli TaxID=28095 RepID=UPI003C7CA682
MVRGPNGPGWVAAVSASMSGTSPDSSRTCSSATGSGSRSATIWISVARRSTSNPSGGSISSTVTSAAGPYRSIDSCKAPNDAGVRSASAANGATSGWKRSTRSPGTANSACRVDRAFHIRVSNACAPSPCSTIDSGMQAAPQSLDFA